MCLYPLFPVKGRGTGASNGHNTNSNGSRRTARLTLDDLPATSATEGSLGYERSDSDQPATPDPPRRPTPVRFPPFTRSRRGRRIAGLNGIPEGTKAPPNTPVATRASSPSRE
ncbi:hypothetical protein FQN55_004359 [Onygenales sp. PD_40]|nr:hypothetical protein FQN55_004359 [Onygenales sp. PD_40]KAK2796121.1 hypothetical protein FQN52_000096 [Onygenales sp. PD_12]KAK2806955.1 hypothetical protein FQN51_005757 [Onygenales sp. PD_10]